MHLDCLAFYFNILVKIQLIKGSIVQQFSILNILALVLLIEGSEYVHVLIYAKLTL